MCSHFLIKCAVSNCCCSQHTHLGLYKAFLTMISGQNNNHRTIFSNLLHLKKIFSPEVLAQKCASCFCSKRTKVSLCQMCVQQAQLVVLKHFIHVQENLLQLKFTLLKPNVYVSSTTPLGNPSLVSEIHFQFPKLWKSSNLPLQQSLSPKCSISSKNSIMYPTTNYLIDGKVH